MRLLYTQSQTQLASENGDGSKALRNNTSTKLQIAEFGRVSYTAECFTVILTSLLITGARYLYVFSCECRLVHFGFRAEERAAVARAVTIDTIIIRFLAFRVTTPPLLLRVNNCLCYTLSSEMVELISYVDPVISGKWSEEQSASRDFFAGLVLRQLTRAIPRMRYVTDAHAPSYG